MKRLSMGIGATTLLMTAHTAAFAEAVELAGVIELAEVIEVGRTVISATRTERLQDDAPVRTEVVTASEIQKTHARTLKEALENIPGLQLREIHGKSGFEVSLQGFSSDQVLVLIDGLPVATSTGSTVDLTQYAIADVERIEVIKGAASAQYGSSAMGGVVNIITRSIEPGARGRIIYDLGSYGGQNISGRSDSVAQHHGHALLELASEQWRGKLAADLRDNQGFSVNPGGWQRQGDKTRRRQWDAEVSWIPETGKYLTAAVQQFEEYDTQWLPREYYPPSYVYPNKYEDITRERLSLSGGWRWQHTRFAFNSLVEQYSSDSHKQNLGSTVFYDVRAMAMDTHYLSMQMDFPAFGNHLYQIGVDLRREELSQFNNGVPEIGSSGSATRENHEIFLQDDYFISDHHELLLGVRFQHDSDFGSYTSPKIAYKFHWLDDDEKQSLLRASIGTGYRVPNLKERYFTFDHSSIGYQVLGNPDLEPESSISYQLGAWLRFDNNKFFDVNFFYNDIRDLIQTDMDNFEVVNGIAIYSYYNIASAKTYGVDVSYQQALTPSLNMTLAHTFMDAQDRDTGQTLTRRPAHTSRIGLDWQMSGSVETSLRLRRNSKELAASSPDTYSPDWLVIDLKLNYTPYRLVTLFAGVDNVFDEQRDFSSGTDFSPVAGRFFYAGLQVGFDL